MIWYSKSRKSELMVEDEPAAPNATPDDGLAGGHEASEIARSSVERAP
jgi:hypothetical protein